MPQTRASAVLATFVLAGLSLNPSPVFAQFLPADVGATVNGFQDDFDAGALNASWVVRGQDAYTLGGGMLHLATATGDPNHLLYELPGYNNSVQEVLARIRVTNFGSGDASRGGVSAVVDPATSQGINFFFRDEGPAGRHLAFLDDIRAWGTELTFAWQKNTWYWLRLRHEPNATAQGGANDVFGKIWLADGTQAEPGAWQMSYEYTSARSTRTGFAGLAATSTGGPAEFDLDYILIKAAGLPSIVVAPSSFVQTPVKIISQPEGGTLGEGAAVTLSVAVQGTPVPTLQWYRNDLVISGATSSSYLIPALPLGDNGARFKVIAQNVVSNTPYAATSAVAVLNVTADTTAPVLTSASALGLTQVQITFSERVESGATLLANYTVTNPAGPLLLSSAILDSSQSNVVLTVSPMTQGADYTVVINNVRDTSAAANRVAANSTQQFTALSFTPVAIGAPQPAGSVVAVAGGMNVTAGGRDIGGTSDQFQFQYQARNGDFDVKVRLGSLTLAEAWAEAGLMAREDTAAGSRFAAALATPSISGVYFQSRDPLGAAATAAGSFPVNYPNTWLRLRRVGNVFTGYAGFDGQNWAQLGTATIAMSPAVLVGLAASSHNTNQVTVAAFRNFEEVVAAGILPSQLPAEPLGQSSRRTSLVISEIHYNPLDRPDHKNLEFVEIFNALSTPEDISGWRLDGDADYVFPPNTILPAGGFLVVATAPADVQEIYQISGVLGPFSSTNSLPNDRGVIQLRHRTGAVFLEAHYDSLPPWPAAADGAGHSLVLARPSYGEARAEAWTASDAVGGSPGRLDPTSLDPQRNVVINEFLANTDDAALDFVELYNHSALPVDISGCSLSDARNTNKFVIPGGTVLLARGFVSFNQTQLGFALSSGGEGIYFRNLDRTRVLDAVRFDAQASGVSSGRFPDGAPVFSELATTTPGKSNSVLLIRDIVINEIMYHPISGDSDDEYIELFNRNALPVSLAGWKLTGGISYTFPPGAAMTGHGYLVIARNAARLIPRYPSLHSNNTLGDFDGSLADGGERVALTRPDPFFVTNNNVVITNFNDVLIDEVTYRDGGRWGKWSDGGGSSLELIDPRSDNRLAANWADSEESTKAPWTTVSVRGVLDNSTSPSDQLQVLLMGMGECLIDDVQMVNMAGSNFIANSTFEANATGWTAEGTEEGSSLENTEGYNSARSYHVRASSRGDNQVNRIRTPLRAAQPANVTNTISAKVRWLRGHPEILFRLRGNALEAAVLMDLPTNLGTPGAANSRLVANAPPAISDVVHSPAVPAANTSVLVTAHVHDPDGVASVQLRYRLDPSATINSIAMLDNGTAGDAVAGDGLYSALLPGQSTGVLVAFHVQATDGFAPAANATFPNDAPTHECLVRFGESVPPGSFPSYRIWMTQASFNAWDTHNNLNNSLNDITLVFGNHRVVYNAGAAYAGSPYIGPSFTTPTGNRCGYSIDLPSDDPFLGDNALVLDWPGGHGGENTAIQEQMAYYIADKMDLAFSHRYFIRLTVNGVTDMQRGGVFEAVLQPGNEFLQQWVPGDADGDFFKIDRAFEFSDAGSLIADPEPQLRIYSTPDLVHGGLKKKTEKYRWFWLKRSFERAHDYTNVFVVADALNAATPEPYTSQTDALVDVQQWMGIFCFEHIINNFDSWGHDIGKNMYMYKPRDGRWQLYAFDLDWLMLVSPAGPGGYTASSGPLFACDDPTITRMYNHPPFRRAYFRAVQNAVSNAFIPAKFEALMDAKYASLVANNITLCDGQPLANPAAVKTWFNQRRTFLVNQLNPLNQPFAITNNSGNDYTANTNVLTLAGTAPVQVEGLLVNGAQYPVRWLSVSNWSVRIVLRPGQNTVSIMAYDASGNILSNLTDTIRVTSTALAESPVGRVVINEIMYHPTFPGAEFVEIHNTSTNSVFDLSGWHLNGADYTFPPGSLLDPRAYLVVAENREAFATAYGPVLVSGTFAGSLDDGGETLSLIQPAPGSGTGGGEGFEPAAVTAGEVMIDTVTYDDDAPWPAKADGQGASLQLIDPNQDNSRVANWSDGSGWRYYSYSGTNTANATNLQFFMANAGDVYVDDVALVEGTQANVGVNLLGNGGFEAGVLDPWVALGTHAGSGVASGVAHAGTKSLHISATGPGTTISYVGQGLPGLLDPSTFYTLSFWYLPSMNGTGMTFRITTAFRTPGTIDFRPLPTTPGAANASVISLPPFPGAWLNELQPINVTGITDNAGEHDPWVELYNPSAASISLDGWHLTDNYSNLTKWPFPAGARLAPGEFRLVWLDGEPAETTANAWHANFRAASSNGSVALVFPLNNQAAVLDYINYDLVNADRSVGYYPDGQSGPRQGFSNATPGRTNDVTTPPRQIWINEWMAANAGFLADPIDGSFDDWFELYNPGPLAVELTGYSLSDRLSDPGARWTIPTGRIIAPGGFLLVWADEETGQNSPTNSDLHAGFKLSQSGEALALFAPDGHLVDSVQFAAQLDNVSEGRWPDGASATYSMSTPTPRAPNVRTSDPSEVLIVSSQLSPNGTLTVTWSSQAGVRYRVQTKNELGAVTWEDAGEVLATGATTSSAIPFNGSPQRFVRIQR